MSSPRPKAYAPYRGAVYVAFLVIVGFLSVLPLVGVVRGLVAEARVEPPPRAPIVEAPSDEPLSERDALACLEALEEHRLRLTALFSSLGSMAAQEGRDALSVWAEETNLWRASLSSVADECRVDDSARDPRAEALSPIVDRLRSLERAYGTHATRLVLHDASTFEALAEAFFAARKLLEEDDAEKRVEP